MGNKKTYSSKKNQANPEKLTNGYSSPKVTKLGKPEKLKINSAILVKDGLRIAWSKGNKTKKHEPIAMEIRILPDDAERLSAFAMEYPEEFSMQFNTGFIIQAIEKHRTGARGKTKGKESSVKHLKTEAQMLYQLFKHICGLPHEEWPSYFQRLVEEHLEVMPPEYISKIMTKDGTQYSPLALSAYCIERYRMDSNITLDEIGLKKLLTRKSLDSFRVTYIQDKSVYVPMSFDNRYLKYFCDLEDMPYRHPYIGIIFEKLGLINTEGNFITGSITVEQ